MRDNIRYNFKLAANLLAGLLATLLIALLTLNNLDPAYSKSNFLGKTLEVKINSKCQGAVNESSKFINVFRILGNGTILQEFNKGKNFGIQYKLNSTINTKYTDRLSWTIKGKKVRKRATVLVLATASQKGDWLNLKHSGINNYTSPQGNKVYGRFRTRISVKISKDKCSSYSGKTIGWYRVNGGKKLNYTCKATKPRCKLK